MNFDISTLLLPCVVIAVAMVTIFTELIKRLDKKDRLKGYRVYVPAVLSLAFSAILAFGKFFDWRQAPFYWAVIFGVSVFGYEAILKKVKAAIGNKDE